jgi:hypothetical protein
MFSSFRFFLPFSNQAKGWRRLSRWTQRFARMISTDVSAAGFEMGGSEGGVILARLMSRGRARQKRAD